MNPPKSPGAPPNRPASQGLRPLSLRRAGVRVCLVAALAAAWAPVQAQFRAPGSPERSGTGLRLPSPATPPAPARVGGESTQCGCAPPGTSLPALLESMQVRDEAFARALERQGPTILTDAPGCVPFAVSRDRAGTVQALALQAPSPEGGADWLLKLSRDRIEGAALLQSERIDEALRDVASVTATIEAVLTPAQAVRAALPPEILSDLRTLLPMVVRSAGVRQESAYVVRAAFDVGTPDRWARLLSVELVERSTGTVVADTYWVDRADLPGGFFNPERGEFEHYFWTNPLSFTRISRGVGPSRLTFPKPRARARAAGKPPKGAGAKAAVTNPSGAKAGAGKAGSAKARGAGRPVIQVGRHHIGVDYAAPTGTPVIAVADGVVSHQGPNGGYGNLIVLSHPGGYTTYYAHLVGYAEHLRPGSEVRRGTEIGYVGSTGRSTGPHLHYEIRQAGRYLDPLNDDVGNGPWQWNAADRVNLLRQMLATNALAASRPIALSGGSGNDPTRIVRRCGPDS